MRLEVPVATQHFAALRIDRADRLSNDIPVPPLDLVVEGHDVRLIDPLLRAERAKTVVFAVDPEDMGVERPRIPSSARWPVFLSEVEAIPLNSLIVEMMYQFTAPESGKVAAGCTESRALPNAELTRERTQ